MKMCPFKAVMARDKCDQESCAWFVSSSNMCAVKDIAHTLKKKKEVVSIGIDTGMQPSEMCIQSLDKLLKEMQAKERNNPKFGGV